MNDDTFFGWVAVGFMCGAIATAILALLLRTTNSVIISGQEFYLDGAVRQCWVTHEIDTEKDSK